MFANAVLIRYGQGPLQRLVERVDTASVGSVGRYEAYLELGDVTSENEAFRKADAALATMAQEQRDITAAVLPITDADRPYVTYRLGNSVVVPDENDDPSAERVLSIGITEDDTNGVVAITLGLRQVIPTFEERIAHQLHRGFIGARSTLVDFARQLLPGDSATVSSTTVIGGFGGGGATWYAGSGVPSDAVGVDGDFYLDTATGDVYTKAGGTWV